MKNITLVEASAGLYDSGLYTRHSDFEPLALEYLAAVLKKKGYNVTVLQQKQEKADVFLRKIILTNPHLVAFSTFTYSFPYSRNLAGMIKGVNENIYTVFGGVHASSIPQKVADDKTIDFVIVGEGEYTLLELIESLNKKNKLDDVAGIVYWDKGIKITKPRERIENLDVLPFPLRTNKVMQRTKIHTLMYTKSEQKGVASVVYSRGCPYGCSYCASKNIWGKTVKWRSARNTVDEIKELQNQFATNTVFFTDLTFNLDKGKVLELCEEIIKRKVSVNWYAMLRATSPDGSLIIDKETLDTMKKAGCSKVSYGLESLIPEIQNKYNKKSELKILKQVLEYGDKIGLINKAYLIIGEPKLETQETLKLTKKLLSELSLDELRISFLTPFPNTSTYLEYQKEGRIITNDWSRYSSDEPILKMDNLTAKKLLTARTEIFRDFYKSSNYEKRVKSKQKHFPYLKKSYEEYFEFLNSKGVIK